MEINMEVPQKILISTTIWSNYITLWYVPERIKVNTSQKNLCIYVYCNTIHKNQAMETA